MDGHKIYIDEKHCSTQIHIIMFLGGGGEGGKECKSYTVHVHLHVLLACTVPCALCRVPTQILDYSLPVHAMYMHLIITTRFVKTNECE